MGSSELRVCTWGRMGWTWEPSIAQGPGEGGSWGAACPSRHQGFALASRCQKSERAKLGRAKGAGKGALLLVYTQTFTSALTSRPLAGLTLPEWHVLGQQVSLLTPSTAHSLWVGSGGGHPSLGQGCSRWWDHKTLSPSSTGSAATRKKQHSSHSHLQTSPLSWPHRNRLWVARFCTFPVCFIFEPLRNADI